MLATSPPKTKMFAYSWSQGFQSPFRPTNQDVLENVFEYLKPRDTQSLIDIGCGDGRVLIECAKRFRTRCYGYELDFELVKESLQQIADAGRALHIA
jgi:cyclopropane fatty-acyl-phospholipid synthase-like methyltransferase